MELGHAVDFTLNKIVLRSRVNFGIERRRFMKKKNDLGAFHRI